MKTLFVILGERRRQALRGKGIQLKGRAQARLLLMRVSALEGEVVQRSRRAQRGESKLKPEGALKKKVGFSLSRE